MSNAALLTPADLAEPARAVIPMTPMDMMERAISTGAGIEVLTQLMALNERYEASQARKAFDEAMAAAKAEIPIISKSRTVDFTSAKGRTHYRYEDLAEVARTVNPILSKHGLSYRFRTTSLPNEPVSVTCVVSHRLGYSEENTLSAGRDDSGNKNSIQAVGSTLTYLQRMTLKAALGLAASEDDDGKAAGVGADVEVISQDQIDQLNELIDVAIEAANSPPDQYRARFRSHFKINAIPDLPAAKFSAAIKAVQAHIDEARK